MSLNTALAQQLLAATNAQAARAAGTPAELALRARARQVAGVLAREEAQKAAVLAAKERRAAQLVAQQERTSNAVLRGKLLFRLENRIDEMHSDLRRAGVFFDLAAAYASAIDALGDVDEVRIRTEVFDTLMLLWHDHCSIDLTRQGV